METPILLNRMMNEIIFEGRNKAYGAFALRQDYNKRMMISMSVSISFFILFMATPSILKEKIGNNLDQIVNLSPPVILQTPVNIPPEIKPPVSSKPITVPTPIKSQIKYVAPPVVTDNHAQDDDPPTQKELTGKLIGTDDTEDGDNGIDPGLLDDPPVSTNIPAAVGEDESSPLPIFAVQQKPEFPNGISALNKYIKDHIEVPSSDFGEQINVLVQFIIDKEGNVYDVKVIRSSTRAIERAAIKVIKEMPKWKPGKNNGKPVEVIFQLPIIIKFQ
jgi:protein TonB